MCQIAALQDMLIRKMSRFLLFVDLQKAYDSVLLQILFPRLRSRLGNQNTFILSILASLFDGTRMIALVNGYPTIPISMQRGLLQGSVLSPLLFNLFIDDLAWSLQSSTTQEICILMFADDIVLLADDWQKLKRIMSTVVEWCSTNGLSINVSKSAIMLPEGTDKAKATSEMAEVTGMQIEVAQTYKYLGVPFGNKGIRWHMLLPSICKKMDHALRVIQPLAIALKWSPKLRLNISKVFVLAHIQYSAGIIWAGLQGMGYLLDSWKELSGFYTKTLCFVLGMAYQQATPSCGMDIMYAMTGLPSLQRWIEEAGARLQFHLSTVFSGCPIQLLQQHPPAPPWCAGLLIPRLPRNQTWISYRKWLLTLTDKSARTSSSTSTSGSKRAAIQRFIPLHRADWLSAKCTGYLCACVLPSCRLHNGSGHDYILGIRNARAVQWALRWRRGVFATHATCPRCRMSFRTPHVGRCKLLDWLVGCDPHIEADAAVYRRGLPCGYSIVDAALNHKDIDRFCMLIERLCDVLKVPLEEV